MQEELQRMGRELDFLLQQAMAQWIETFDGVQEPRSRAYGRYVSYPHYVSLLAGARWNLVAAGETLQRQPPEEAEPGDLSAQSASTSICLPVEPDQLMDWVRTLTQDEFGGRSYRTGRDIPRNWSRPCCEKEELPSDEEGVVERVTEDTWTEVIEKSGFDEVVVEAAEVKETTYGKGRSGQKPSRKPRKRDDG